jgi:uncharacterized protein YegP (UPF0339 family)
MKADHEKLEEEWKDYEVQLRGLNSYVKELKDKTAQYGTQKEQFEVDLMEAEHNIKYYEGEMARVKELIEKGPVSATYQVYKDASGEWRWKLLAANHQIIADSGEGYRDKQDCLHAIALVKDSKDAPVREKG